ncbi:MAG: hypothetical protein HY692_09580 [Cyanobacteria bacterium NC_groundwater_1444_Ag_S-0.65um_54_12]|nr:hypothetical protein [Cyanobacteria bacterium NC_groundwater_1444_Ag_S-0.65um_54_12]
MQAEIVIISNAPGELAAWVRPVVSELGRCDPQLRLTIALVPCPYASGREAETLRSWNSDLTVWTPQQTLRYLLMGKAPEGYRAGRIGVVLFLGGDQLFGVLLARRLGFPLLVYTETVGRWASFVDRFLLSDRTSYLAMRGRRVPPAKVILVGNLMVDSVKLRRTPHETRQGLGLAADTMVIGLLPGSKPFKVLYVTPFLLRVAELLYSQDSSLQFILQQSPFTTIAQLERAISDPRYATATGGTTGRMQLEGNQLWIVTPKGCAVRIIPPEYQYDGMAVADLALTVPGTNTAELAILGVPQVVVLPLNKPEEIPLEGIIGQLGSLPLVGPWLKRQVIAYLVRHVGLVALPNRRLGRMATPELIGVLSPEEVACRAAELLQDDFRRRQIKLELLQAMGYPGAASAIADVVGEVLAGYGVDLPSEVVRRSRDASG